MTDKIAKQENCDHLYVFSADFLLDGPAKGVCQHCGHEYITPPQKPKRQRQDER